MNTDKHRFGSTVLSVFICVHLWFLSLPASGEKADITAEQAAREEAAWMGLIPDMIGWSPDSSRFYYHAGNNKAHHPDQNAVFEVGREGGKPRRLSAEERLKLPPLAALAPNPEPRNFSRDRKLFVYERDGDVFLVEASGQTRRLTNTETPETNAHFSHDDRYVLFESGQNLFGWTIGAGELRQFTRFRTGRDPERKAETAGQKFLEKQQVELFGIVRDQEAEREQRKKDEAASSGRPAEPYFLTADQTVSRMELSPDGRQVTFLLTERAHAAEVVYQRPVTRSGFTEPATTRPKVGDPTSTVKMGILTIANGKVKWVNTEEYKRPVTPSGPWWSPDGKQAVIKVVSGDFKDLWIERLDCETGQSKPLFQDHDDAWIPLFPPAPVRWMPDSRALYLTSERDGYRHLYSVDLEGNMRQLTRGRFDLWYEAPAPVVSLDGKRIYFHANLDDSAEQNFYAMSLEGGPPVRLTPRAGWTRAFLSPDEKRMALLRSTPGTPNEVYLADNAAGAEPRRISYSTTPEFESVHWTTPEFVRFPDAEGVLIPGRLFKPRRPHPLAPALVQIHGSGYAQIVRRKMDTDYLHIYQEYLLAQGYTILEIDYRGSAGYGRDFRTSIYRRMGGYDLDSAAAAVDYLVSEHGIDRKRIGIFGRSYGGYLTLMALFTRPGLFAAGAAMAPVTDWAHYNHMYTGTILNLPQEDEESYRRSSPIYFAQNLRDPLLILHGMVDSNVLYQDSVRLSQRLIELKKTGWQLFSYPVENHVWETEETRLDCLRRVREFFDSVLKK